MDIKSGIMGLAFALIWSSAFTSARIIVQVAPPLSISALRFLIAGLIAVSIAYFLGQRAKFTHKQWLAIILFGLCQNAIYLGFFFMAMAKIEASVASIIASSMPLLVAFVLVTVFKDKLSILGYSGLIIGFLGVVLIMFSRLSNGINIVGIIQCVLGVLALTIATLSVKSASTGGNLFMVVGLQMLVGSAALSIPAFALETWDVVWDKKVILAFAYTIVVPGIIATYIWFLLVERIGATKAATFHFLNPFFGVAIAAMLLDEKLSYYDMIGVVIIMLGIFAVQRSKI
ncbi:MAG: DMT family transporter [Amylibacter sp.]|nr:DMT family transporter [Amylibacter sp.]MDG1497422.1 DMT family transporter [Amylibacter sp.]MDG1964981.1 DMT family transporter [Amylibacter sp.]MDG2158464.1 DMT family transporter [Amylibacter sp.]|tara:strand:+ start:2384 stop:3244 length:861 start_codon:yes stop_codon:yes gene_type:complete